MKKTNERSRTDPHKRDVNGTNPKKQHQKEAQQQSKQPSHKHGTMRKQVLCMSGLKRHGMAKCNKQNYKLSGAQYATTCILTKHHINYLVLSHLRTQQY